MAGPEEQKLAKVLSADPAQIHAAGDTWQSTATGLGQVADEIDAAKGDLAGAWKGKDADAASAAFDTLSKSVRENQDRMTDAATAMHTAASGLSKAQSAYHSLPAVPPSPTAPTAADGGEVSPADEVRYLKLSSAHSAAVNSRESAAGAAYTTLVGSLDDAQSKMSSAAPQVPKDVGGGGALPGTGGGTTPAPAVPGTGVPGGLPGGSDGGPQVGSGVTVATPGSSVGGTLIGAGTLIGGVAAPVIGATGTATGQVGQAGQLPEADGAVAGLVPGSAVGGLPVHDGAGSALGGPPSSTADGAVGGLAGVLGGAGGLLGGVRGTTAGGTGRLGGLLGGGLRGATTEAESVTGGRIGSVAGAVEEPVVGTSRGLVGGAGRGVLGGPLEEPVAGTSRGLVGGVGRNGVLGGGSVSEEAVAGGARSGLGATGGRTGMTPMAGGGSRAGESVTGGSSGRPAGGRYLAAEPEDSVGGGGMRGAGATTSGRSAGMAPGARSGAGAGEEPTGGATGAGARGAAAEPGTGRPGAAEASGGRTASGMMGGKQDERAASRRSMVFDDEDEWLDDDEANPDVMR